MSSPVASLLAQLVSIPSVNPMGRPADGPHHLEDRLTAFLLNWFAEREIRATRQEVRPRRDNVLAYYEAPGASKTILFDVHQDTVPVDGMTVDPFGGHVEGGKLYGRGACDVKGSMAAMMLTVDRLCRERPKGSASVILACTVDEEFTHVGSSALASARPPADLAIVAEPTELNLVPTHKGAIRWTIRTRGRACHSSRPWDGVNAIYRMAPILAALERYATELSSLEPDPMLGPPSLSVGRVTGGSSVNIVPEFCEIEIDRRVIPGEVSSECPARVAAYLDKVLEPGIDWDMTQPWVNLPALSPEPVRPWLGPIGEIVGKVIGRAPEVMGVPYGTDAGPLSEVGMPCLVLGPGDIAQAHTKDEWIALDQLEQAVDVYYQLACKLG